MALMEILDRLRSKKRDAVLTANQEYIGLVFAIARGDEFDADTAAEIIEAAGVTEEKFSADIELQTQRMQWRSELDAKLNVRQTLPRLQASLDQAQAALDDAIARLKPTRDEAAEALNAAKIECERIGWFEDKLLGSVLNPDILERKQEIEKARRDINVKLRPLQEDHRAAVLREQAGEHRLAMLRQERNGLSRSDLQGHTKVQQQIEEATQYHTTAKERVRQLAEILREVQRESDESDNELAELHVKSLEA